MFAADTTAIFAGPLAVAAIYNPVGGGSSAVRIIRRMADATREFGGGRFASDTITILVATAAASSLQEGDQFVLDDMTLEVRGAPLRDGHRLYWRAEARQVI